jgi:hypothetical protein
VYFILDHAGSKILYVGKGKGKRMFAHVRDVRMGKISSPKKHAALATMLKAGEVPHPVVFCQPMRDGEALSLERSLIALFKVCDLLNALPGQRSSHEHGAEMCHAMLASMKSLDQWCSEAPRSEAEIELYHRFVEELKETAVKMERGEIADTFRQWVEPDGQIKVKATYKGQEAKIIPPKGEPGRRRSDGDGESS